MGHWPHHWLYSWVTGLITNSTLVQLAPEALSLLPPQDSLPLPPSRAVWPQAITAPAGRRGPSVTASLLPWPRRSLVWPWGGQPSWTPAHTARPPPQGPHPPSASGHFSGPSLMGEMRGLGPLGGRGGPQPMVWWPGRQEWTQVLAGGGQRCHCHCRATFPPRAQPISAGRGKGGA